MGSSSGTRAPGTFWTEAGAGLAALRRGFSLWRHSPRLMLLGAAPALIVGAVLFTLFVVLLVSLPALTDALTPFADAWGAWRAVVRVGTGAALVVLAAWAMVTWYAALTLMIGDPFFEKIAEHVERSLGDPPPGRDQDRRAGLLRQASESLRLALAGALLAVGLFVVGLLPVIGTVAAVTVGAVVGGRLLVTELTGRALDARGLDLTARRALLASRRTRTTAFGAATYLMLLVPVLSVAAMPAIVAGATVLARDLLHDRTPAP